MEGRASSSNRADLRYLCSLTDGPANLLAAWEQDVGGPYKPSEAEYADAMLHLVEHAEEISLMTRDIGGDVESELLPRGGDDGRDDDGDRDRDSLRTVADLLSQPLPNRAFEILQAMSELGAVAPSVRRTAPEIAVAAFGRNVSANSIKDVMAELARKGWTKSREGRGGGAWFTEQGGVAMGQLPKP
ncbi:MAG TPA: hypothetical protein VGN57_12945 [Pirellulaceae bacterium]|nr:hypothetical protein [Pirellulaceae bacterium]